MAEIVNKSTAAIKATCPFFKCVVKRSLMCESFIDGSETATFGFMNQADLNRQLTPYCACDWKHCENYRMVMNAKYPDDEEGEHGQI